MSTETLEAIEKGAEYLSAEVMVWLVPDPEAPLVFVWPEP